MSSRKVQPIQSVQGTLRVPGDKSISHRALLFALLMDKTSASTMVIDGLLEAEDVLCTKNACQKLGVGFESLSVGRYQVKGNKPIPRYDGDLYMGNSGTAMRLLAGLCAGTEGLSVRLTGDKSLSNRPMQRISEPLRDHGAYIETSSDGKPPLSVHGRKLRSIQHLSQISSAQVKSSLILAALSSQVSILYGEKEKSRDHSERMLSYLGIRLQEYHYQDTHQLEKTANLQYFGLNAEQLQQIKQWSNHGYLLRCQPPYAIQAKSIQVPGDISSAAFFMVLATILPNSSLTIEKVGLNPSRIGIITAMQRMGANIVVHPRPAEPEPMGDIVIQSSNTRGACFEGDIIANIIDEIPILAILAAYSDGVTEFRQVAELRVKESDRIEAVCSNLSRCGVKVEEYSDGFRVFGWQNTGDYPRGGEIQSFHDHRIAMAFSILGLASKQGVSIDEISWVQTSFPNFYELLELIAHSSH